MTTETARYPKIVAALEELEEELAALDGAVTGSLVLAGCDSFGDYVLPAMLRTFAHERPRADIRIHVGPSGDVVRAVARRDAHLGIAGQTRRSEIVHAESLLRDELAWVASGRSAALPGAEELAARDLREIKFLGGPGVVRTIDILRSAQRQPTPLEQAFEHALRLHCAAMQTPSRHATAAANP